MKFRNHDQLQTPHSPMIRPEVLGEETSKIWNQLRDRGFLEKYFTAGPVLELGNQGYRNVPVSGIVREAITLNLDIDADYDGYNIPYDNDVFGTVYSSHVLEHVDHPVQWLREQGRVVKNGGFLVVAVPDVVLYEGKKNKPSRWNGDHKRFYTASGLLSELEAALGLARWRVRLVEHNDMGWNPDVPLEQHPHGCLEIIAVMQKVPMPKRLLGSDFDIKD